MGEPGFDVAGRRSGKSAANAAGRNQRVDPRQRRQIVQAKLVVGAADDRYEQEADSIAAQVTNILRDGDDDVARDFQASPVTRISRIATVGAAGGSVDHATENEIDRARSGGRPLDGKVRRRMEGAFGTDFASVRMHVGSQSDNLNERIQARAFTTGSDIFVRRRDYAPGTAVGDKLLAHELAHTIQQASVRQPSATASAQRSVQRMSNVIQRDPTITARDRNNARHGKRATTPGSDTTHDDINQTGEGVGGLLGNTNAISDDNSFRDAHAISKAGSFKDAQGNNVEGQGKATTGTTDAQIGVTGASADLVNSIVGISKAIAQWRKDDGSGWDKAGAMFEGAAAVTTAGKGVGNLVKSGSQLGGAKDSVGESAKAAGGLGGFADAFGGIKSTFTAIRGIVDLCNNQAKMSEGEKAKAAMDVIKNALEAAKSGVQAAKGFLDMVEGPASAALVNSIPGLGIAIGCVELIIRAYDLIVAQISVHDMKAAKREAKTAFGGAKGASSQDKAKQVRSAVDIKEKQNEEVRTWNADPRNAAKPKKTEAVITDKERQDYKLAGDYLTAKGLQYINDKRTRRALLKMAVAMTKIAGDATTLGGMSAPVGIALKISAVVLDFGATVFRKFKQWARDKVAESDPQGQGKLAKVFNIDKTTAKKNAEYERILDDVFDIIVAAKPADATAPTPAELKSMSKADKYVKAMGFSLTAMRREAETSPANLRTKMIEAMKKRE